MAKHKVENSTSFWKTSGFWFILLMIISIAVVVTVVLSAILNQPEPQIMAPGPDYSSPTSTSAEIL